MNVLSALVVGLVGFIATQWVAQSYAHVGLSPGDARVGVARPLFVALVVIVATLAFALLASIELVGMAMFFLSRRPGRLMLYLLSFLVCLVVVAILTTGHPTIQTTFLYTFIIGLLAVPARKMVRAVRRSFVARALAGMVALLLSIVMIGLELQVRPPSYRAMGGSRGFAAVAQIGLPMPSDFVFMNEGDRTTPAVVLERGTWLTVINPCDAPPYAKRLVRFDRVELVSTTFAAAMRACP